MRVFAKQFITMMCVLLVFFTIFGNILVNTAFETTMDRETSQSLEEMKIFQYAMLASLDGLPKDYQAVDTAVAEIAGSIKQSLYGDNGGIVVYDKKGNVLFQDSGYQGKLISQDWKGHNNVWQITSQEGHYYLESLCEINSTEGDYVLELHRCIDHVYEDRNRLYECYLVLLILAFVVFAVVLFILSFHFTRPIRKLSQATRAFANGDYKRRVQIKGHDEMADLGRSFNRMAGELEENIGQLEEKTRQQEEFIAGFSHELKTPLTSIIGYADIMRSRALSDEERSLSANYIVTQGKRLERLALKMLEMSYVDKQEFLSVGNDVLVLAETIRHMTESLLEQKGIRLVIRLDGGVVTGDSDFLLSLFSNLIDNARKACGAGGTIWLDGECREDGYCFQITDNGCGMPEEEIYKITEPFYMIDKSRARKEGGAGIGMALCQKIIRMHHAEWNIQSRQGEGTTITIFFPNKTDGKIGIGEEETGNEKEE